MADEELSIFQRVHTSLKKHGGLMGVSGRGLENTKFRMIRVTGEWKELILKGEEPEENMTIEEMKEWLLKKDVKPPKNWSKEKKKHWKQVHFHFYDFFWGVNSYLQLKISEGRGVGIFAKRNFYTDEIIFINATMYYISQVQKEKLAKAHYYSLAETELQGKDDTKSLYFWVITGFLYY